MLKPCIVIAAILLGFVVAQAQLRYYTVANTSTVATPGWWNEITAQGAENVAIVFKRGSGTSSADLQIKVARS